MNTDALIATLAAQPLRGRSRVFDALTIGFAAILSAASLLWLVGMRPGLFDAISTTIFYYKVVLATGLFAAGAASCRTLTEPQGAARWFFWLLPVAIWIGFGLCVSQGLTPDLRVAIREGGLCAALAVGCSLPPTACALVMMRSGAPKDPAAAGAAAGLLGVGIGLSVYKLHCPVDTPMFVAVLFSVVSLLVTLLATLSGKWFLRW